MAIKLVWAYAGAIALIAVGIAVYSKIERLGLGAGAVSTIALLAVGVAAYRHGTRRRPQATEEREVDHEPRTGPEGAGSRDQT